MANEISITIKGLDTEEDRKEFAAKCAEFWMEIISEKISSLPMTHERKVEFAEEVVNNIRSKGMK